MKIMDHDWKEWCFQYFSSSRINKLYCKVWLNHPRVTAVIIIDMSMDVVIMFISMRPKQLSSLRLKANFIFVVSGIKHWSLLANIGTLIRISVDILPISMCRYYLLITSQHQCTLSSLCCCFPSFVKVNSSISRIISPVSPVFWMFICSFKC